MKVITFNTTFQSSQCPYKIFYGTREKVKTFFRLAMPLKVQKDRCIHDRFLRVAFFSRKETKQLL